MQTVRWGIIGCGDVTEVKSGPALQQALGSSLVAVMRRDGQRAADYARRHGVPRWYDDADALIADEEVDAVYIATPPGSHCKHALKACAAGKPAYVEKPMARSYAECVTMIRAFQERGLPLYVAYYRRALPRFLKAREIIASGQLGTLSSVIYRFEEPLRDVDASSLPWRYDAQFSGGGLFFDLGSHALDILDYLLGPLTDVAGLAGNCLAPYDVEDGVVLHWRTSAGVLGAATWNFAGFDHHDEIVVVGTCGRMSLGVFGDEPIELVTSSGTEVFERPNPRHIQLPLIQTVVDELRGGQACPSTGESAARTARIMDLATENYYGSRDHEFWNDAVHWPGRRQRN